MSGAHTPLTYNQVQLIQAIVDRISVQEIARNAEMSLTELETEFEIIASIVEAPTHRPEIIAITMYARGLLDAARNLRHGWKPSYYDKQYLELFAKGHSDAEICEITGKNAAQLKMQKTSILSATRLTTNLRYVWVTVVILAIDNKLIDLGYGPMQRPEAIAVPKRVAAVSGNGNLKSCLQKLSNGMTTDEASRLSGFSLDALNIWLHRELHAQTIAHAAALLACPCGEHTFHIPPDSAYQLGGLPDDSFTVFLSRLARGEPLADIFRHNQDARRKIMAQIKFNAIKMGCEPRPAAMISLMVRDGHILIH